MVTRQGHAAEVAQEHGHTALAKEMRNTWKHLVAHRGYRGYTEFLQAQRARWLILRTRFRDETVKESFRDAEVDPELRGALDFLLVRKRGLPARALRMILEFWDDVDPEEVSESGHA